MGNKKIGLILAFLFVIAILVVGFWRTTPDPEDYQVDEFLMDTFVRIRANGEGAEEAVEAAVLRMRELADQVNVSYENSQVAQINEYAGQKAVEVDDEILSLLKSAQEYGEITEGRFDVTIGPILDLWGLGTDNPRVPDEEEIADKLELVNYEDIIIDEEAGTVMLAREGMKLNLGGASKGYIVDQGVEILKERGIESALIAAGDVRAVGTRPDGKEWTVAIRNPRMDSDRFESEYVALVRGADFSIATAGDYERYFVEDGQRYHHILDAQTGYPVRDLVSVSVVLDASLAEADSLSTALFTMGFEEAQEYIESRAGIEGMLINGELEKWESEGFEGIKPQ